MCCIEILTDLSRFAIVFYGYVESFQGSGGVSGKSLKSGNALCEVCSKPANFLCRFQIDTFFVSWFFISVDFQRV